MGRGEKEAYIKPVIDPYGIPKPKLFFQNYFHLCTTAASPAEGSSLFVYAVIDDTMKANVKTSSHPQAYIRLRLN